MKPILHADTRSVLDGSIFFDNNLEVVKLVSGTETSALFSRVRPNLKESTKHRRRFSQSSHSNMSKWPTGFKHVYGALLRDKQPLAHNGFPVHLLLVSYIFLNGTCFFIFPLRVRSVRLSNLPIWPT
jgi:hypothetical protein